MRLGDASAVLEQAQHEIRYDFKEGNEKSSMKHVLDWNWAVPFLPITAWLSDLSVNSRRVIGFNEIKCLSLITRVKR